MDWSRRKLLAALGTAGVGGYWWVSDGRCPDRRAPDWTLDGRYWSPPTRDDGDTFVSEGYGITGRDAPHRIASLDARDGSPNWVFTVVGAGAGAPRVSDGAVYVGTGNDRVYAFDRRTGHVEWRYDAGGHETYGGGAWGRPAAVAGVVVAGVSHSEIADPPPTDSGAYTHRVVALAAESGEEVWSERVDAMAKTGPVAVGETVVAATKAGSVYGFGVADGTERWRTVVPTTVRHSLFADRERVHAASVDGQVAALNPESGEKRWTASLAASVRATERDSRSLLVGTESGAVVALARDSGRERWRFSADAPIGDLSSDRAHAFVLDQRGLVHVLDAETGEARDRFRVAENAGTDACGWVPRHHRGTGLDADEDSLAVTGPWVGHVRRYRE
ncbi:PQQ-binding-like beta-propeller repeat protein [Halorussus caseinilyticus]|uniref:PQQ-binding-like beta-propeller repeat protein n=1 Tax=Halorussus caseinilyticus TaxID=3034025 RepID=A0ABD5WM53_9EURY|nr:PQQ-binding-like beta-propeller repeat protein [Halorussus sp. DT72]